MRALWIADVLRGAGLEVVEQPGWQTRGVVPAVPQTAAQRAGEFASIVGHMAHHTASTAASTLATNLHVVLNGNGVARGPIANVLLVRDGTYHVIASGRCNHAGAGSLPWVPGSGNDHLLSTEAVNNGVGELWSADMMAAYEIGTAAMLRGAGLGAERATTHAEWTTRKIDPAGPNGGRVAYWGTDPGRRGARNLTWDPVAWRAAVARWMVPPDPDPDPDPVPDPVPEEMMMHVIVGNDDDRNDPRRWVWDGASSMRLLVDEADYQRTASLAGVGLVKLHPSFATLSSPFWMPTAERARYGQS